MGVDIEKGTLAYLLLLSRRAIQAGTWKEGMDALMENLREAFVFDNVAAYLRGETEQMIEVAYARAVGRGKRAEADAAWGETLAGQVIAQNEILLQEPNPAAPEGERLDRPFLLGIPLSISESVLGALVYVRFGGPPYRDDAVHLASFSAMLVSYLFEKRAWKENMEELEKVQRQMRLQDDFVATISHELRTPLGFIKGYSTTLLREDTTWDEETRREFLTIIDEEADRLTELIENVLESARLQSKTLDLNFQPLRIDSLIRDVATRVRARHEGLRVILKDIPSSLVRGDGARLAQVFENLFSNALKYAPDSNILISAREEGDSLRIAFSDEGLGLPQEHLPYIFDRFYRVPGQPRNAGTGLGLFICRRIVEAHHGKIWAESPDGGGTTFFIELPVIRSV